MDQSNFFQKTNTLLHHNVKRKSSQNEKVLHQFNLFCLRVFFCRFRGQHGKGGDNIYSSLPYLPTHKHSDIYLQFCISDDYLIIPHLIFRLHEIYQPVEISKFTLLVDIITYLIKANSHTQVLVLNSHQLSSYNCIRNDYSSKLNKFVPKNQNKSV